MENSEDEKELRTVWKHWRDAVGPKVKELYDEYVTLSNRGARDTGYSDAAAMWRDG